MRRGLERLSRRRLVTASAILGSGVLAACTRAAQAPSSESSLKEPAQLNGLSWTFWDDPEQVGYDKIKVLWEEKHPKVRVTLLHTPSNYEDKVRALLAGGEPLEIIQVNDDYNVAYYKKGWTRALDQYIKQAGWKKEDFWPDIWNFGWGTGHFTYVTIGNRSRGILYNVDLFEKHGLKLLPEVWDPQKWSPARWWDWDTVVQYAQRITTRQGDRTLVWGCALWTEGRSEGTWSAGTGGDGPYSKDGKRFILADEPGMRATQWLADLSCKYGVAPDSATLRQQSVLQLFTSGRLGFFYGNCGQAVNFRRVIKDFRWDVGPMPAGPSGKNLNNVSLVGMCLPTSSKNPDWAWRFLEFVMEDEPQRIIAANAFIPSKIKQAELFLAPGQPPKNQRLFIEGMGYSQIDNFTENTEEARLIFAPEMQAVVDCKEPAKAVLERIRPKVEAALQGRT